MYVKPVPPCPRCLGDQKEHGLHETWTDCSDEMEREDLRSPARRARPGHGTVSQSYSKASMDWELAA